MPTFCIALTAAFRTFSNLLFKWKSLVFTIPMVLGGSYNEIVIAFISNILIYIERKCFRREKTKIKPLLKNITEYFV